MILPDVNMLVYAHREDIASHSEYERWLLDVVNGNEAFGMVDQALSGFIRVVTHPRIFRTPTPPEIALEFCEHLRSAPNRVEVVPGERHWRIFAGLCREAGVRGNLIPDAWVAALAIESGSEWITTDRDYARFPGLYSHHPLALLK
jgi:uncharacterized protein